MTDGGDVRAAVAKEGRLWLLALICAAAGAFAVYRSGSFFVGLGVFAAVLAVLGTALFLFEKRRKR